MVPGENRSPLDMVQKEGVKSTGCNLSSIGGGSALEHRVNAV